MPTTCNDVLLAIKSFGFLYDNKEPANCKITSDMFNDSLTLVVNVVTDNTKNFTSPIRLVLFDYSAGYYKRIYLTQFLAEIPAKKPQIELLSTAYSGAHFGTWYKKAKYDNIKLFDNKETVDFNFLQIQYSSGNKWYNLCDALSGTRAKLKWES